MLLASFQHKICSRSARFRTEVFGDVFPDRLLHIEPDAQHAVLHAPQRECSKMKSSMEEKHVFQIATGQSSCSVGTRGELNVFQPGDVVQVSGLITSKARSGALGTVIRRSSSDRFGVRLSDGSVKKRTVFKSAALQ